MDGKCTWKWGGLSKLKAFTKSRDTDFGDDGACDKFSNLNTKCPPFSGSSSGSGSKRETPCSILSSAPPTCSSPCPPPPCCSSGTETGTGTGNSSLCIPPSSVNSGRQPLTQILYQCRIPQGYSFVIATALGSFMLIVWQALHVNKARRIYKIPLPRVHDDDCQDDEGFNQIVKPFYYTMENLPQFLLLLLVGGLAMPYVASAGGVLWIIGRIDNSLAHYHDRPNRRIRGAYGIWGMVIIMFATGKFALGCCKRT